MNLISDHTPPYVEVGTPGLSAVFDNSEYDGTYEHHFKPSASILKDYALLKDENVHKTRLDVIRNKKGFIIDMDGVLYHANTVLPGIPEFLRWLHAENKKFIFLTNASDVGRSELSAKIQRLTGVSVSKENFMTSAIATANFLATQTPNGTAFVVGDSGLMNALFSVGYTIDDVNPDYVVVGETKHYNYQMIERAVHHIRKGAKFIGTNRDVMDRVGAEVVPSTGALVAPIELMTNTKAYFIGKPNPLIVSQALLQLGTHHRDTVIIGDRMDTDIQAGIEFGLDTILVLSGVTAKEDLRYFAFKPKVVLSGVKELFE